MEEKEIKNLKIFTSAFAANKQRYLTSLSETEILSLTQIIKKITNLDQANPALYLNQIYLAFSTIDAFAKQLSTDSEVNHSRYDPFEEIEDELEETEFQHKIAQIAISIRNEIIDISEHLNNINPNRKP